MSTPLRTTARPTPTIWTLVLTSLLLVVLGVRLSFVGRGAMAFPDEERYYQSVEAVKSFAAGQFKAGTAHLLRTQGRPGDAMLRMLPAGAQGILHALGGPGPHAAASLLLPVLFTYGIAVVALWLYYRVARLLLADKLGTLLSALLYACLTNSNLYIRHILPYELALCCFLGLLFNVLRQQQLKRAPTVRSAFGLGAGAAFTYTIYPGYFFVPAILLVVLISNHSTGQRPASAPKLRLIGAFGGGVLSVIGLFEMLGLVSSSYSYLGSCLQLAGTIVQGDFQESFSFVFHYLLEVEGPLGLGLLGLLGAGLLRGFAHLLRSHGTADLVRKNVLYLALLGAFLLYAALGFWGHKLVFYGRILHLFLPFLVLFAVDVSSRVRTVKRRQWLAALLVGAALYSFGSFAWRYHAVVYPLDLLAQLNASLAQKQIQYVSQTELSDNDDYRMARQNLTANKASAGAAILVNFGFLYPITNSTCNAPHLPAGYRQVISAPHFLTLPAYGFEGFAPHERAMLRRCQYHCQVFVHP